MSENIGIIEFSFQLGKPIEALHITAEDIAFNTGLPEGLTLNAGYLEGTPTVVGDHVVTVQTKSGQYIIIKTNVHEAEATQLANSYSFHKGDDVNILLSKEPSALISVAHLPEGLRSEGTSIVGVAEATGSYNVFVAIVEKGESHTRSLELNILPVNATPLSSRIQEVLDLDRSKYENFTLVEDVLVSAQSTLAKPTELLRQKDLNAALKALNDSVSNLVKINQPPEFQDLFKEDHLKLMQGSEATPAILKTALFAIDEEDGILTDKIEVLNLPDTMVVGPAVVKFSVTDSQGATTIYNRTVEITEDISKRFKILARPILYIGETLNLNKYIEGDINLSLEGDEQFDTVTRSFKVSGVHTLKLTNGFHQKDLNVAVISYPEIKINVPSNREIPIKVGGKMEDIVEILQPKVFDHMGRQLGYFLSGYVDLDVPGRYNLEINANEGDTYTTVEVLVYDSSPEDSVEQRTQLHQTQVIRPLTEAEILAAQEASTSEKEETKQPEVVEDEVNEDVTSIIPEEPTLAVVEEPIVAPETQKPVTVQPSPISVGVNIGSTPFANKQPVDLDEPGDFDSDFDKDFDETQELGTVHLPVVADHNNDDDDDEPEELQKGWFGRFKRNKQTKTDKGGKRRRSR